MKRRIIAVVIGALCLLSSAGCGVIDTRPPCAEVKVDESKTYRVVDEKHDDQSVTLLAVIIKFDDEIGRAYAYARDGDAPVGLPKTKDNPLKIALQEGEYTFYYTSERSESCKTRVTIRS